jgi:tetratricopeptide (TPR) repeat protein
MADELRREGNEAFARKDFRHAEGLYTRALEFAPRDHVLLSNRSAARLAVGDADGALADANQCVALCSAFAKGHIRRAHALEARGEAWLAVDALDAALKADADMPGLAERAKAALAAARKTPAAELASLTTFRAALRHEPDLRTRLAFLAHAWNAAAPRTRVAALGAFFLLRDGGPRAAPSADDAFSAAPSVDPAVAGGAGAATGAEDEALAWVDGVTASAASAAAHAGLSRSEFTPEAMIALPLDNYEGVALPAEWLAWFGAQSARRQWAVLRAYWDDASELDRTFIVADLMHFFGYGAAERRAAAAAAAAAEAAGSGAAVGAAASASVAGAAAATSTPPETEAGTEAAATTGTDSSRD